MFETRFPDRCCVCLKAPDDSLPLRSITGHVGYNTVLDFSVPICRGCGFTWRRRRRNATLVAALPLLGTVAGIFLDRPVWIFGGVALMAVAYWLIPDTFAPRPAWSYDSQLYFRNKEYQALFDAANRSDHQEHHAS